MLVLFAFPCWRLPARPCGRFGALLSLLVLVSLGASPLHAQEVSYQQLIEEALTEFQQSNWEEAYALFQRAHTASPNARALRGMGMASFELRDYPRALRELQAALDSGTQPLTDAQRGQVDTLMARASRLVGRIEIDVLPATAQVFVNHARVSERSVVVRVGEATVRAELQGHEAVERAVDVRAGGLHRVELRLGQGALSPAAVAAAAPAEATAPANTTAGNPTVAPVETTADDGGGLGLWPWVAVGAAVLGAAITGVVLLSGSDTKAQPFPEGNAGVAAMALGGAR